jgi:hypothetical protein
LSVIWIANLEIGFLEYWQRVVPRHALHRHLFFYHRFFELADELRLRGWLGSAARCDAIAETHYQAAPGDDDPSDAAAMAMPVPQPSLFTNAVSATSATRKSSRDFGDSHRCRRTDRRAGTISARVPATPTRRLQAFHAA